MYALCVSGAVNTQGFVWKFFMRYIYIFIHSFIHVLSTTRVHRLPRLPGGLPEPVESLPIVSVESGDIP